MAKVHGSINMQTVNIMRGHVDFYLWRGVPVARSWPRPPRMAPTPGTVLTRNRMAQAMAFVRNQPVIWQVFARRTLAPNHRDWMDIYRRSGLLQATNGTLCTPIMPVAVHVTPDPLTQTTLVQLYCWDQPEPEVMTQRIRARPYDRIPFPFAYQQRPYTSEQQEPAKKDWILDTLPMPWALSVVWHAATHILDFTVEGLTDQLTFASFPYPVPYDPETPGNAYPLTPLYDSKLFPEIPESVWPPLPGALLQDYTAFLADLYP